MSRPRQICAPALDTYNTLMLEVRVTNTEKKVFGASKEAIDQ